MPPSSPSSTSSCGHFPPVLVAVSILPNQIVASGYDKTWSEDEEARVLLLRHVRREKTAKRIHSKEEEKEKKFWNNLIKERMGKG